MSGVIVGAVAWLLCTAAPGARRLGYVGETVGTLARYRRWRQYWAPHLRASRAAMRASAAASDPAGVCVVLGSGGLLDVPLAELAGQFRQVFLADLVHPARARWAAARQRNVARVACDLTGSVAALARGAAADALHPGSAAFTERGDVSLVISANVLSQLGVVPGAVSRDDRAPAFTAAAVRAHLSHLARLQAAGARICLITDVAWIHGRAGRGEHIEDPLAGVTLPDGPEWDWPLAPEGELGRGVWARHRVRSLDNPDLSGWCPR